MSSSNITLYSSYVKGLKTIKGSFPFYTSNALAGCYINKNNLTDTKQILQSIDETADTQYLVVVNNGDTKTLKLDLDLSIIDPSQSGIATYSLAVTQGDPNPIFFKGVESFTAPTVVPVFYNSLESGLFVVPTLSQVYTVNTNTLTPPITSNSDFNAAVFVQAGGGGGSIMGTKFFGGGGGGYSTGYVTLLRNKKTYKVVVGAGGPSSVKTVFGLFGAGGNGGNSAFDEYVVASGGTSGKTSANNQGAGNVSNGTAGTPAAGGIGGINDKTKLYGNGGYKKTNGHSGVVKIIYAGAKRATGGTYSYDKYNSTHIFDKPGTYTFEIY